ncbi:MAG: ROK family glucokinase [Rubricoccaceae bacterium]
MRLGIEVGGTKLQLGVGDGVSTHLAEIVRLPIDRKAGAPGILAQIKQAATRLNTRYQLDGIGIGFGGPVDSQTGTVITSHQVDGWDGFELAAWSEHALGLRAQVGNDCDVAALAEARFGAGQGSRIVLYVTAGTGVGGGLVTDGALFAEHRVARAEIGHLRPGLEFTRSTDTVESMVSGPGLATTARRLCGSPQESERLLLDTSSTGRLNELTGLDIATAAQAGNPVARDAVARATRALGWAIAQTVTLTAAETVVIGGGVSGLGGDLFFEPVRRAAGEYVFPPLRDAFVIVPAALGEEVVVHGALALAADNASAS